MKNKDLFKIMNFQKKCIDSIKDPKIGLILEEELKNLKEIIYIKKFKYMILSNVLWGTIKFFLGWSIPVLLFLPIITTDKRLGFITFHCVMFIVAILIFWYFYFEKVKDLIKEKLNQNHEI